MPELNLVSKRTTEFCDWFLEQTEGNQTKIDARIRLAERNVFLSSRDLGDGLFEFKWPNGMRVYFSRKKLKGVDVIVLWGGFKGKQSKDISHARDLKTRYENDPQLQIL